MILLFWTPLYRRTCIASSA